MEGSRAAVEVVEEAGDLPGGRAGEELVGGIEGVGGRGAGSDLADAAARCVVEPGRRAGKSALGGEQIVGSGSNAVEGIAESTRSFNCQVAVERPAGICRSAYYAVSECYHG